MNGFGVTEATLLIAAVTLEIPILMIVLSRVLPARINWIANTVVAAYAAVLLVSQSSSPDLDDVFFLIMGLLTFVSIAVIAIWSRKRMPRD